MSDGYLTVQEVAALARCEHKSVRRAIAAGDLTAFRGPKRLLIREADARAWIEHRPVTPTSETPRSQPRRRPARSHHPTVPGRVAALRDYAAKEGRL